VTAHKVLSLLGGIAAALLCISPAFAAFNYCRPLIGQEAEAYRGMAVYLVPRWETSTNYIITRLQSSGDGATYAFAQDVCIDVVTAQPGGSYGWSGTVRLMARDVRLFYPQRGWGNSLGQRAVETFNAVHAPDGWRYQDVGTLGQHVDPRGDVPPLPNPAAAAPAARAACQPWEAPDANGNCRAWRAH
jgi:hypothetical protein